MKTDLSDLCVNYVRKALFQHWNSCVSGYSAWLLALQMKGRWESVIINVWSDLCVPWNKTARPCYFQNRIILFCLPIYTFMYLLLIYIFSGSVCLLCCSQIGGPILGIYKSLTDTLHKCRNWERRRAVSCLGIHKSDFWYSVVGKSNAAKHVFLKLLKVHQQKSDHI